MVESSNISPRGATPTPAAAQDLGEPASHKSGLSSVVYEPPPSPSDKSGGLESAAARMFGEGRGDAPDSSSSQDQTRSNRGRSPRPHATPRHRPPAGRPIQPPSSGYPVSSLHHSAENIHNVVTSSSSHNYSPSYGQRPGYVSHVLSMQPPVGVDHTPTPPYAYPQQYHPGIPDNTTVQQNLNSSYQPMMQPPSAVYQYPQHSQGGSSSIQPMYPHHQANPSPPPHFPPPPGGRSGAQSLSYGPGQFQALRYPSPINPQYPYHSHSYPSSPVYSSPYAPSPFGQHYPSPIESDRQAGWWYFPPATPQHQYEGGPYPGHYSMPFPAGVGHHENSHLAPSPSSLTAYPPPSTRPTPSVQIQPAASPSPRITDNGSSADASGSPGNRSPLPEKSLVRRPYHPNPPPHRSEWVMWAGNVPSDATHDELWRFFNQLLDPATSNSVQPGVISIFLISRSCCAFVNFESEAQLQQAIARFNGNALRPDDPRCPRLVCRVRRKDDDLKAGVGGQRGQGVHTRWVKDQKMKGGESGLGTISAPSSPPSDNLAHGMSTLSVSSDEEGLKRHTGKYSSSSGSYASTNSSILTRHFPQRYFILKSLTQYDLDLSVDKGLWATQKHNEGILDQAYRTSHDVYLIFSVNKSGEFYGYARMVGPVQGEHRVSWATRTTDSSSSSRSSLSPVAGRGTVVSSLGQDASASSARGSQHKSQGSAFFSPGSTRLAEESPLPLSHLESDGEPAEHRIHAPPTASASDQPQSAPGEVGPPRSRVAPQVMKHSLDQQLLRRAPPLQGSSSHGSEFELDPSAPIRAMRSPSSPRDSDLQERSTGSKRSSLLKAVVEEEEKGDDEVQGGTKGEGEEDGREDLWGESFKIEWLCTEKLPFHRTRHLRNPWNHDREVKVSRDGTELEPSVGKRLVDEWTRMEVQPAATPGRAAGSSRRGAKLSPSGVEMPKNTIGATAGDTGTGAKRPS